MQWHVHDYAIMHCTSPSAIAARHRERLAAAEATNSSVLMSQKVHTAEVHSQLFVPPSEVAPSTAVAIVAHKFVCAMDTVCRGSLDNIVGARSDTPR